MTKNVYRIPLPKDMRFFLYSQRTPHALIERWNFTGKTEEGIWVFGRTTENKIRPKHWSKRLRELRRKKQIRRSTWGWEILRKEASVKNWSTDLGFWGTAKPQDRVQGIDAKIERISYWRVDWNFQILDRNYFFLTIIFLKDFPKGGCNTETDSLLPPPQCVLQEFLKKHKYP